MTTGSTTTGDPAAAQRVPYAAASATQVYVLYIQAPPQTV